MLYISYIKRGMIMTFTIYINEELAQRVMRLSKSLKRSRNSIITEALEEWLNKHTDKPWPKGFFDFEPIEDVPDFEALRKKNKAPTKDPLE